MANTTLPKDVKGADLSDLGGLTIAKIRTAFADGTFTAEDLALASIAQIKALNGKYNAIIFECADAVTTAREVDRRRAAGEKLGPLAGIPVVIKDTVDMVGYPSTAGWGLLYSGAGGVDLMPARDAPVAARMKAADAVILGKTNVPILSWTGTHANDSWAGPTINVAIEDRAPGGSSAGTSSAVASHMCLVGLAEETGGSIQNPASAQGLVGIKATIGMVPNAGVVPLSGNRDMVGPIARTVEDAAICLDAIAGFTTEDPKTLASVGHIPPGGFAANLSRDGLQGKRIGLYGPGWRKNTLSDETSALYERAKKELLAAGAILVEDPFADTDFNTYRQITLGTPFFDGRGLESMPYDMTCYLRRLGPDAALKTWAEFVEATKSENPFAKGAILGYMHELPDFVEALKSPETPPALPAFTALKETYLRLIDQVFAQHNLDALAYPQMICELPGLHSGDAILETTVGELNIAGIPGITVPAGYYASGAPFELIFLARQWDDAAIINMAYAYEQSTLHRKAAI
ncbi:MAG: amidase [Pseudotabrizicola sp.]|uniref:amidase n=1 Tax=Pseudotabrizicola sp. TaxID=2939647 RepID=UPI00271A78BE|nr:amidase [Pseudotabrizicola sp.]MDO9640792.1 amidase [Pseudotabrizicola sp.]